MKRIDNIIRVFTIVIQLIAMACLFYAMGQQSVMIDLVR
jgi:hypothetical protein